MAASGDSIVRLAIAGVSAAIAELPTPGVYILLLGDMATGSVVYASNIERDGAIETLEGVLDSLRKGEIAPVGAAKFDG